MSLNSFSPFFLDGFVFYKRINRTNLSVEGTIYIYYINYILIFQYIHYIMFLLYNIPFYPTQNRFDIASRSITKYYFYISLVQIITIIINLVTGIFNFLSFLTNNSFLILGRESSLNKHDCEFYIIHRQSILPVRMKLL